MKTIRQIKRQARHLFRLCLENGTLNENSVHLVLDELLQAKPRGYLSLAKEFDRLLRLECLEHTASVESAVPLPADLQASVRARLVQLYGPSVATVFSERPALIGGMRIKVGSDVYDGSVKANLAALERSFETGNGAI